MPIESMGRWAIYSMFAFFSAAAAAANVHNVVLFVPDGLRRLMVDAHNAPAMTELRDRGVDFENSHSLYPTFTTANASAFATGHYLGDTGDFSNGIYVGFPAATAGGSITPYLENDAVLGEVDQHFAGNYLGEITVLESARRAGYATASIGKVGPVLIQDHRERSGEATVIIDDLTGGNGGIPLAAWLTEALPATGLPLVAPGRGLNGLAGTSTEPGTHSNNLVQQDYFAKVLTQVLLPRFKSQGKPFFVVFWSRDPDGSQHNQGDSLNTISPGINGPTSLAGIKNADSDLARVLESLETLGLAATTDVIVSADHGFATISKQSATSPSARRSYPDVPAGSLPPGFLALDLSIALQLPLWDPDQKNVRVPADAHPRSLDGIIGENPLEPRTIVAGNGGSDLIYIPESLAAPARRQLVRRIVDFLLGQDYVSGMFIDSRVGVYAGTLPLQAIGLLGAAITPRPTIVVNFRSYAAGCSQPLLCTVEIADASLQQGQGMHGGFSRAETMNFMAAVGPDFKRGFIDKAPVSNADVAVTVAHILRLDLAKHGRLLGRPLLEAMPGGATPHVEVRVMRSLAAPNGLATVLDYQTVGGTRYFDAGGFPGRTMGLKP